MRRVHLSLEEDLWEALHLRAQRTGTTISELLRTAVRDRYMADKVDQKVEEEERARAMLAIVGLWKDRHEFDDAEGYVRKLRSGDRLKELEKLRRA